MTEEPALPVIVPAQSRATAERLLPLARSIARGGDVHVVVIAVRRLRYDTTEVEPPGWLIELAANALDGIDYE